jgi:UDP-N-acetylmuramate--alanine ligase
MTSASHERRRAAASLPWIDLRALARTGAVHFVGIAGAGMSALAELVLRSGGRVTGSDLNPGEVGASLQALGAQVWQGHNASYVADAVAVVATSAVPADHPELVAANAAGVPILKRAQALGMLVNRGTVLAIAGTHGKTTTTAMTTSILDAAGLEPTAFVGGRVGGWGSGLRLGSERLFVVEADEYDRSFLTLEPTVAVVTSVEADHLDIYESFADVEATFTEFLRALPDDGLLAACIDDPGAARIAEAHTFCDVLTYGTSPAARLRAIEVRAHARGSRFIIELDREALGLIDLGAPGLHNVRNALGAFAAARFVGADYDAAARALSVFGGVARRFQEVGVARDVLFIDDYAHHPTEVEATIATARGAFPERRIVAVFQPHLYSRTRDFADAFGAALAKADVVWVTDVYPAREAPIPGVSGALIADAARAAGARELYYVERIAELKDALAAALRRGDACIAMGAGDIDRHARAVHAALMERGEP